MTNPKFLSRVEILCSQNSDKIQSTKKKVKKGKKMNPGKWFMGTTTIWNPPWRLRYYSSSYCGGCKIAKTWSHEISLGGEKKEMKCEERGEEWGSGRPNCSLKRGNKEMQERRGKWNVVRDWKRKKEKKNSQKLWNALQVFSHSQ